MTDYRLTSIDQQLRLQASVWRLQRIEGDTRTAKQQTLQRIDRLLEQRLTATTCSEPVTALQP